MEDNPTSLQFLNCARAPRVICNYIDIDLSQHCHGQLPADSIHPPPMPILIPHLRSITYRPSPLSWSTRLSNVLNANLVLTTLLTARNDP